MDDFENRVRSWTSRAEFPPTPDLATRTTRELEKRQPAAPRRSRPTRLRRRRGAVVAFAVFLVSAGAVMAAPGTRHALLRFFDVEGVSVKQVETLPKLPQHPRVLLGEATTLTSAKRRARTLN